MNKQLLAVAALGLSLAACGQNPDDVASSEAASADAAAPVSMTESAVGDGATSALDLPAIPANAPKLAYSYGMGFALPADDIGTLMRRHADLCEKQGPTSCRIIGMDLAGRARDGDVHGTLTLAIAANHARAVGALLEDEAADAGAEQTGTTIGSEEVSKTIVDTEARIRAREDLRDRLTEVLRTRKGKVSELVEAERQVAAVNEEIDQARSWLAETKGRVAFSTLAIDYEPQGAFGSGFLTPIKAVFGGLGTVLGYVVALLLLAGAILVPVMGAVHAGRWANRRFAPPSTSA